MTTDDEDDNNKGKMFASAETINENGSETDKVSQHSGENECGICYEFKDLVEVSPCRHQFCTSCLNSLFATKAAESLIHSKPPCPLCRVTIDSFPGQEELPPPDTRITMSEPLYQIGPLALVRMRNHQGSQYSRQLLVALTALLIIGFIVIIAFMSSERGRGMDGREILRGEAEEMSPNDLTSQSPSQVTKPTVGIWITKVQLSD